VTRQRYCPCGLDLRAPYPGRGARGLLGTTINFCSVECLRAYEWLRANGHQSADHLATICISGPMPDAWRWSMTADGQFTRIAVPQ
jgi:hypothetical protein